MSFFQKNLLLSVLFTLLIGVTLIASSYYFEGRVIKQSLATQGEGLGSYLSNEIETDLIQQAAKETSMDSSVQKELITALDRVSTDNVNVAQAYLIAPERNDAGKYFLLAVPTHIQEVFQPGSEIDDYPGDIFQKALDAKKPQSTDVYADDIGNWFTVLSPVLNKNGEVVAMFAIDMSANIIQESQMTMVKWLSLALLVLFVVTALIQYLNLKRMLAPVRQLSEGIDQVASGDLDVEIPITTRDELGTAAAGFNEMVKKIRGMISDLDEAGQQIRTTFAQVASVSESTKDQADNVLLSLEEMTQSTEHLAREAENGNHQLLEINTSLEDILVQTADASRSILVCVQHSNESLTTIETLQEKSNQTEQITLNVGKRIYSLEGRMRQINQLLSSIQDVAEQTALLSLNASIEAARAGEHGRGFSVVAEEIRKLSSNSKQASEEIASLLNVISDDIGSTGQEMRLTENSLREQSEQVENTINSFFHIRDNIKQVADSIEKVNSAIQIVEQNKDTLLATIESVSSMSEETSASIEMIQQGFLEQVKSIQHLNDSCQELQVQANELK